MAFRNADGSGTGLHQLRYGINADGRDYKIRCHSGLCYCHRFAAVQGVCEVVKTLYNYQQQCPDVDLRRLSIDPDALAVLDNRLETFFGPSCTVARQPQFVLMLVRVAGGVLYAAA